MKQIVCLAHAPWRARPDRTQQLLARLTGAQILLFEPAPRKGAPMPEQGRRVRAHLTVYTLPAPIPGPLETSVLHRRRLEKIADFIQQTMDKHRFREPVLWCTCPDHAQFLDMLAYRGVVYDCDRFWDESGMDLESDLTRNADVVFAASFGLIRRLSPCNDNIALLPNGVNPVLFQQKERSVPPQVAGLSGHRVLGRVGSVNNQVDLDPLLYAARHRPEWTFVLMGPVTRPAADRLRGQDNIVLTGPVNPLDVPDYLDRCDLLFDLFRRDRAGSDVASSRIYEYLATGKPIVAVVDPAVPDLIPELVDTAYDGPGFLRRCKAAFGEDPSYSRRRRALARDSSWANRAAQVSDILDATGLF